MANNTIIRGLSPTLQWLTELLAFFQSESIKIPVTYRDKVLKVKQLLNDEPSGILNSILDFAINSALVDYRIETDNRNLTKILNSWLLNINSDLRGKVPTGLRSLAKEYFRERWKGSSHILLRTFWEEKDGLILPTSLFFVDGEDIVIGTNSNNGIVKLGDETYFIRVSRSGYANSFDSHNTIYTPTKDDIKLPRQSNEEIFVQKPFESWGIRYPIPFIIKRGIYRNAEFLKLMSSKGEFIVAKALEYLLITKKGTQELFLKGNVSYSEEDLKKAKEDFQKIVNEKKTGNPGFPNYTTNFDTEISEYIPDYKKAINEEIYNPLEKRILAGLGLIQVIDGTSSKKDVILNPKPFISEVEQGIEDFKILLNDIVQVFVEKNLIAHKKWAGSKIKVTSSPVKGFMDDKVKTMLRSIYDRGGLSKKTLVEVVGELDFDTEVNRRADEKAKGLEEKMYAPVIQNQEGISEDTDVTGDSIPADKKGIEKKNYNQSGLLVAECLRCDNEFDFDCASAKVYCPTCDIELANSEYKVIGKLGVGLFEQAPYNKVSDLPNNVKDVLPSTAQDLWMRTFNAILKDSNSEDKARKIAWYNVKKHYKKSGKNWIKKNS